MKWSVNLTSSNLGLYLTLIAATLFVFDLHLPLGIAMAVPYVIVIVLSLIRNNPNFTLIWAIVCTMLTVIGYYLSPHGNDAWFAVFNRLITLCAIWVIALISIRISSAKESNQRQDATSDCNEFDNTANQFTTDAIMIVTKNGSISSINRRFSELFGYQISEVKGRLFTQLLQGPKTDIKEVRRINDAIDKQKTIEVQVLQYHKNGAPCWVDISIIPRSTKGETSHFICSLRDVSKQKQLERALETKIEQYHQATQAKTQLMHLISNELTKPAQDLDKLAQKVMLSEQLSDAQRLGEQITHSSRLLQASLNYVIKLAHLDNDHITPRPQQLNLTSYMSHKRESIQALARGNGLLLEPTLSIPNQCDVLVDENLLDTIIDFFVLSAVSQLRGGTLWFESGLAIDADEQQLLVCFTFEDNGLISKQLTLNKHQASPQGTFDQGINAGFRVIEKALIALLGHMEHRLSKNGHTQIDLQIPVTLLDTRPKANDELTPISSSDISILIAEDNKVNYIVLAKLLNKLGYERIDHATDGAIAVTMATDKQYDLILMDHHMPNMTGLEATTTLLNHYKVTAKVIACTADLSPQVRTQFFEAGATNVIYKPVKKDVLLDALSSLGNPIKIFEKEINNKGVA